VDIPSNPHRTYKNQGWVSLGDWLGTGIVAPRLRKYRPFEEARAFVHGLGLQTKPKWEKYSKGRLPGIERPPEDIPANPPQVYKDEGWASWGDWLGTCNVATFRRKHRQFEQAREFVHSLMLRNGSEWQRYCRDELPEKGTKPRDIPANPVTVYKGQWLGMGDWLGTGTIQTQRRKYRSYKEARQFVHHLGIKNSQEWRRYCKGQLPDKEPRPAAIPRKPDKTYRGHGWINWGDWLGTGSVATYRRQYRLFNEARAFVRSLGLKNQSEWFKYCKGLLSSKGTLPKDIPSNPNRVYKDHGWIGIGDWLGK
jgi:hypothetical protein